MSRGTSVRLSTSSNMTACRHIFVVSCTDGLSVDRLHVDYFVDLFRRVVALLIVVLDVDNISK